MSFKKMILPTTIIATMGIASISTANADSGWYIGAKLNFVDGTDVDSTSTEPVAGVSRRLRVDGDSDTDLGIHIGKTIWKSKSGDSLSLELSYADSEQDISSITFMDNNFSASQGTAEGSFSFESILLSAIYKWNIGQVNPYVGLGVGSVDFDVDGRYGGSVGLGQQASPPFATSGDSATAINFRVGLEYNISKQFGLFAEYSKTDVDDIEFSRTGGGPGGLATTSQEGDFDFDTFSIGVNYRF